MALPFGIIDWHITANGHVYISSVIGGCVETKDNGEYFTENEVAEALEHRSADVKRLWGIN